ncbi:MAG: 2Fe-2S iron-sulfur cluster binding domain-containing protein [Thiothrix sp.]|nr:2Fe-2S iron-sulfur cluster binding domain-containing protein [Thiothrix sp.]
MATVTWRMADGSEITADVINGNTLMESALDNDVPRIFGDCGGSLACATCHVVVDDAWIDKCGSPGEEENDLLEMTDAPRQPNSRLSCQIVVSEDLDGLVVNVPEP